jgi:hypothetical protein
MEAWNEDADPAHSSDQVLNKKREIRIIALTMPGIERNIINGWAGAKALSRPATRPRKGRAFFENLVTDTNACYYAVKLRVSISKFIIWVKCYN